MKAYSAAYTDEVTTKKLNEFGLEKERFHITTCFDDEGLILNAKPLGDFFETALISNIVEWTIGDSIYLIAELSNCEWSKKINFYMHLFGAVEKLDHVPHITLIKGCDAGESLNFKDMIGMKLVFDSHKIKSF